MPCFIYLIFRERETESERERDSEEMDQFPSNLPKPHLKEGFILKFCPI